jgi:hypothetical protein
MKMRVSFGAIALFLIFGVSATLAAKPETSIGQLQKDATHIVVGTVQTISVSRGKEGDYELMRYVAKITIRAVEKGKGIEPGQVIEVLYLSKAWLGNGTPPPGDLGHRPMPKTQDFVRVYLTNAGYNGAGQTTDGGFDVYFKNGFQILEPH